MNVSWNYTNFNVYNQYRGFDKVIYSYHYSVTVTVGDSVASQHGLVRLKLGDTDNFIPYEQVTKDMVDGWTRAHIDTQSITNMLTEKVRAKNANVISGLPAPWEVVT
jgi:hypothetical protein